MKIKFITGNKNKYQEMRDIIAPIEVEQVDIDLAEIQSLDSQEIIRHKLREALNNPLLINDTFSSIIVEDTSLHLACLNNDLPGPMIKWFLKTLNPQGIFELCQKMGNAKASGVTRIGYAHKDGTIEFFEGRNDGEIVFPIGDKDFGWGPIFKPNGSDKTYGQMDREEKFIISMRAQAALKLKQYLINSQNN